MSSASSRWSLKVRHLVPEVMDQPGLETDQHHAALRGLERINSISRSGSLLWKPIEQLARQHTKLRLLDLATGAGDVPLWLWHRARSQGVDLEVAGCDCLPVAVGYARNKAKRSNANVDFFLHDVVQAGVPEGYDIVTCSLFLHHLEEADAVTLLRNMAQATRRVVLVNDLRRSWTGLFLAYLGTHLLSRSPVVHQDGPQSVRAAFTLDEVRRMAESTELTGAIVERRWPWRLLLDWRKP